VNRARDEAQSWRDIYRQPIPGKTIADRIGQYISAYTLYSSVRPFGTCTIIGTMTDKEPTLYMVEPSGVYWVKRKRKKISIYQYISIFIRVCC
jgi:20S proteasome subunit alpha 7